MNARFPIDVTDEGMDNSVNDEQPKKADSSIEAINDGILTSDNEEHP